MELILPQKIKFIFVAIVLIFATNLKAQTKTYATVVANQSRVDNATNAVDGDLLTKADINAGSGILAGIGAYSGHLDLEYTANLPANTTSFTKIETEDDLLPSLLGGTLGGLLSDITGILLLGNQEFTVMAQNDAVTVLEKQSSAVNGFSTDDVRVVTDKNNDYFLAVTPEQEYNRIRIENRMGSLIGLGNTRELGVYETYYTTGTGACGLPSYTSFSGNGISLDLLGLGGAGVKDPHFAIDGDPTTYSELGLGIIGVAANIQQTVYYDTDSDPNDNIYILLEADPSLINVGLLNNVSVSARNGAENVFSGDLSSLLNVDLLGILQNGDNAIVAFNPGGAVDRVTVNLESLLNVAVGQQLRIYDIFRAPEQPELAASSTDVNICSGSTVDLVAESNGTAIELRWYDAETGGNLLATVNSGDPYTTPVLNADQTYYVAAAHIGCTEESPRVEVPVTVAAIPTATDITVVGNDNPICSQNNVVLVPSSSNNLTFNWFLDANETMPITDGMVLDGATYNIDANGVLTVSGLTEVNSPYTFYVGATDTAAGCTNAPGDVKAVPVTIIDSTDAVSVTLDSVINLPSLISIFQGNPATNVTGSVTGDASPGDEITLAVNGETYTGILDANLDFSVAVDGINLLSDIDNILEAFISGGLCTSTDDITVVIPDFILDNLNQVFCASDDVTLLDLDVNGNNVLFFDSLLGSAELDVNAPLVDGGTYYVGLLNVPLSVLPRIAVTVTILNTPAPTTINETQTFCIANNPVVADIQVNESSVIFYDSATDGTMLDPSTALVDGTTYYVANTENGCESTTRLAVTVLVEDQEVATITGIFEDACIEDSYMYTTESGKQNYVWTVTGGTITEGGTSADSFITVTWDDLENTSVVVSYDNAAGCTSTENTLEVAVISCGEVLGEEFCLFVYNEFTPNNDGYNDFFEVKCIEDYSSNTLKIFNRNGNRVFETVNYKNDWNGVANVNGVLSKGSHLPSGTYYYTLAIPELNRTLKGWIQLAR